jgi:hypothetical protein
MNDVVSRGLFNGEVERLRAFGAAGLPGYDLPIRFAEYPRVVVGLHRPGAPDLNLRIEAPDWNSKPASYQFVEGSNHGRILRANRWPGRPFPAAGVMGYDGHHHGPFRDDHVTFRDTLARGRRPISPGTMICLRGTREYHEDHRHHLDHWMPISTMLEYSFASMAAAIQERVYRLAGVQPVGATP